MKLKLLLTTLLFTVFAFAQKGTVKGTITDKEMNNEPLPFASVTIKGTTIGANTDEKGTFSLSVPEGNHILMIAFLGYQTIEVPFKIASGETKTIDKALGTAGVQLEDVVLKIETNRQKESALLVEQKKAIEIKQSIGAQELSRKGVSDVATAVTKTTGITKQEGTGNIYVRGLGDRYNSTTMNGLPIPSNDPEKKNIRLDIFPTDIVEYVSIDKVYNGKTSGDFAGGNVDIVSKDYKGKGFLRLDIGSNANTNALAEDNFRLPKGPNSFGFSNPANPKTISTYDFNTLQFEGKTPVAGSFGISGGKSFDIGSESKLSIFATGSFGNEYTSKRDGSAKGSVNGDGSLVNRNFKTFSSMGYNTNTTGLVNVGYKINNNHKVSFNSLFINTSSQVKDEYFGYIADLADAGNGLIRRSEYVKNTLFVNQLLGEHTLSDRSKFNWGVAQNNITGDTPDRMYNTLRKNDNGYTIISQSKPDNHRYFQRLKEYETVATASVDYKFHKTSDGDFRGKFTAGYNGRFKNRDFKATQFNFKTFGPYTTTIVDPDNLDLFYNQQNLSNGYFEISTFVGNAEIANALDPQKYTGEQIIHGGYLNTEYKFSNKLTAVLGLRAEYIFQKVDWKTQLDPVGDKDEFKKTTFLPNLIMKYELNEKQNLRLGMSKTYTLPQFKERALFIYEDVTEVKVGNPDLYPSDNYNLDLKWEMFPKSEELISFTAFGKYILNPINEVTIASSTNDISFVNTGDRGYVAGAEAEFRKLIFQSGENNSKKVTAGINASYMYTTQDLNGSKVDKETRYNVDFTKSKSAFTGASPLLLNADVSFFKEWNNKESNISTTLAYSYFSDRIYALGTNLRGDQVDKAVGTLDFIVKSKINKNLGIGLTAKNILNPKIERVQENNNGDVTLLTYTKGMNLSFNVNYQF
ncbi:TonB-dependent receptor [Flavobacterium supellecticarium]|uniref:TonB-dependent receptor n=1 Tax=Flavobacterium supellecticarium TaxID=2565924 RepID=A0A4S3ZSA3_9FLAO|nr:TonB-dependent receptor [Flavobacterium supellecticarium]THF48523.1 TonB-dependent receptor [Flavobacterium supellecticarium]